RIEALYFQQSEQVMRRIMKLPYVSFGTDAGSYSLDTVPHYLPAHPRAFGTFTRVLGKYVREERLLTLPEAVRKMTSQPARNLKLHKRGELAPGYFADVVVFHPDSVADHASYEQPHRYATGVSFVFVNGTLVLNNGEHTGAMPGRVLRGPGWGRDFYYATRFVYCRLKRRTNRRNANSTAPPSRLLVFSPRNLDFFARPIGPPGQSR